MNFLRPLGWVDPWSLAVWLYKEQGKLRGEDGVRRLVVIRPGENNAQYRHPDLSDKWKTLRNAIARARRLAEQGNLELVQAELEALDPGGFIDWEKGGKEVAVHIAVVTNPAATLYCGNEFTVLGAGQIVARAGDTLWSAVNLGDTPRIHLILTLRERAIEEEL